MTNQPSGPKPSNDRDINAQANNTNVENGANVRGVNTLKCNDSNMNSDTSQEIL